MEKYKTNNENLVFIGKEKGEYGEEYYLNFSDSNDVRGWTFMGLRPQTEDELRRNARETEPCEMLGISSKDYENIYNYFDEEKFADDMEEDWLERHDSQAEREDENGETLYLGFGSGTDIFHFFKENKIKSYKDYTNFFEEVGLDEKTFELVYGVIKRHFKLVEAGLEDEKGEKELEVKNIKEALNFKN